MAISVEVFREHSPSLPDSDAYLERLLKAATAHVESILGFAIDDGVEFPDGTPADVEQAVLMLAAEWCENREASITGTIITTVPIGVSQILNEHRRYSFDG